MGIVESVTCIICSFSKLEAVGASEDAAASGVSAWSVFTWCRRIGDWYRCDSGAYSGNNISECGLRGNTPRADVVVLTIIIKRNAVNSDSSAAINPSAGWNVGGGTTASLCSCTTTIALSLYAEAATSVLIRLARSCL